MTKEEIAKFVREKYPTTSVPDKTEILFKNGQSIFGYFNDDESNTDLYEKNHWVFVVFSQNNIKKKEIVLDGNTFKEIIHHRG